MSVQSEIDRIISAVGSAYSAIVAKGGTAPTEQTVANLSTAISSIPSGGAKTCSIEFSVSGNAYIACFACLQLDSQGNISAFSDFASMDSAFSITSVLTDSLFVVCSKEDMSVDVYGGVSQLSVFTYLDTTIYLFKTPSDEGVTGTINLLS